MLNSMSNSTFATLAYWAVVVLLAVIVFDVSDVVNHEAQTIHRTFHFGDSFLLLGAGAGLWLWKVRAFVKSLDEKDSTP